MQVQAQVKTQTQVRGVDRGVLLVAGAALLFACKGTLIKYIYGLGASVADLMILRLLFSMPIYLCIAIRYRPQTRPPLKLWIGVALCGMLGYYVSSYFDMMGLQTISPGLERMILYTYPAFVVIFSTFLLNRPLSLPLCLCIAVIYCGLGLVFYADVRAQPVASIAAIGVGSLFVLCSAVTFAGYAIGSEYFMRTFSSALFTSVAMLAAGAAMSAHYAIFHEPAHLLRLSAGVYGWSALTALLFTVVPAFMMSAGVRRIGSGKASAVGMVGPVATVVVAAAFLGETVSVLQIVGLAVVMAGVHRLHRV